jgi:uncharacterized protein YdaU (DUF1376 family)
MRVVFYPRYPLDYARDTSRLRLVHHGAYAVMLDDYYVNGPLPADIDSLCALCKATAHDERQAVRYVADTFFPVDQDGYRHNKRADAERIKMVAKLQEAKRKSQLAVEARRKRGLLR